MFQMGTQDLSDHFKRVSEELITLRTQVAAKEGRENTLNGRLEHLLAVRDQLTQENEHLTEFIATQTSHVQSAARHYEENIELKSELEQLRAKMASLKEEHAAKLSAVDEAMSSVVSERNAHSLRIRTLEKDVQVAQEKLEANTEEFVEQIQKHSSDVQAVKDKYESIIVQMNEKRSNGGQVNALKVRIQELEARLNNEQQQQQEYENDKDDDDDDDDERPSRRRHQRVQTRSTKGKRRTNSTSKKKKKRQKGQSKQTSDDSDFAF